MCESMRLLIRLASKAGNVVAVVKLSAGKLRMVCASALRKYSQISVTPAGRFYYNIMQIHQPWTGDCCPTATIELLCEVGLVRVHERVVWHDYELRHWLG